MQDQSYTPTTTAACAIGQCGRCRGRIVSLTDANGQPCQHSCHQQAPALWGEAA